MQAILGFGPQLLELRIRALHRVLMRRHGSDPRKSPQLLELRIRALHRVVMRRHGSDPRKSPSFGLKRTSISPPFSQSLSLPSAYQQAQTKAGASCVDRVMAQHNPGSAERTVPTRKPNSITLPAYQCTRDTLPVYEMCGGADVVVVVVLSSYDAIVQQTRDNLEIGPVREVFTCLRTYWWTALFQVPVKTFMTAVQSTTPSLSPLARWSAMSPSRRSGHYDDNQHLTSRAPCRCISNTERTASQRSPGRP